MKMKFMIVLVFLASITIMVAEVGSPEVLVSSEKYLIRENYRPQITLFQDGNGIHKDYVRVVTDKDYDRQYLKEFKTKTQALKYAKAYMRKH